jgi:Zn-dependent peptidase ImmA (M78 family)
MLNTVDINPKLLKWARERAGLLPADISSDKRFRKYEYWERGEKMPTFKQLEDFASKTYTPFGYLFLPEPPPEEKIPIPDFRTIKDKRIQRPSPNLLETIQTMQSRQEWMRDFLVEDGYDKLSFVGSAKDTSSPEKIADDIRNVLGITAAWAKENRTWEDAFRALRDCADEAGIVVVVNGVVGNNTSRKLDPEEFRGFVLIDDYAPLIFINRADSLGACMFTLAHELAHVWLGCSGVFNFDRLRPDEKGKERLCNEIAAEFLVPKREFEVAWASSSDEEDRFRKIAGTFKVSPLVIARRALDLGYIPESEYFAYYNSYMDRLSAKPKPSGGDFYASQVGRIGRRFGATICKAVKEGRMLYRDAYLLTGLQGNTFESFSKQIEGTLLA